MGILWSDHESRREQIIEAAEAVFLERGYVDATLAQVARRSGKAVGSVQHLGGKKPELAREVHRRLTDRFAEHLGHSSLGETGKDLEAVVRRSIAITAGWVETSLPELDLIAALERYPLADDPAAGHLWSKLSRALTHEIRGRGLLNAPKLDGARLFALILAPVFAEARLRKRQGAREGHVWSQMADTLTAAALAALTRTAAPSEEAPAKRSERRENGRDLFNAARVETLSSRKPRRTKAPHAQSS